MPLPASHCIVSCLRVRLRRCIRHVHFKGASLERFTVRRVSKLGSDDGAKLLGIDLAKKAKAAGIEEVVFDRGGFRYTGRVAELAAAAREGGLKF